MVLGVCAHVLKHAEDAEDAFQATFLVLAQNAAAIRKTESLASWLHGAAYRAAMNARRAVTRRRFHERRGREMLLGSAAADVSWREVQAVLDEEILRLSEKYRAVFILCCVEGRSRAEAAQELALKEGTVSSRLAVAKKQLQERLTRRGIALSAVLAATALAAGRGQAAVPALLAETVARAALASAVSGASAAGLQSPRIATIVRGITRATFTTRSKIATALLLATAMVVAGAGLAAHQAHATPQTDGGQKGEPKPLAIAPELPKADDQATAATDRFGDPLPRGAVARLGTVRFRPGTCVMCVAFSPDGKFVAAGGADGSVSLWDAATGKERARLISRTSAVGEEGWVSSIAISPDGKTLAVGHANGASCLRLWDVSTGKELRAIVAHRRENINSVAFSPDGKVLASGGNDGTMAAWDPATGNLLWRSDKHGVVSAVAYCPDGKSVASGDGDGVVRLWDTSSGKELGQIKCSTHKITAIALSPDGKSLASGGDEFAMRLWSVATGKELRETRAACGRGLAFAPDGRTLASSGHGHAICLWDVATGKELHRTTALATNSAIAFSPDGKILASGGLNDWAVRLWDVATAKELRPFGGQRGGAVAHLVFSPGGKYLATGSAEGDWAIRLWEVATGAEVRQFPVREAGSFLTFAFSPDGALLAGGADHDVHVWEVSTGKMLFQCTDPDVWVGYVAFSPQGRTLACGGRFNKGDVHRDLVTLWDAGSGKVLRRLEGNPSYIDGLAFSADGRTLASRSTEDELRSHPRTILLWDVATGKELRRLRGVAGSQGGICGGLLMFLDQNRLVSAGRDWPAFPGTATLQLWDTSTGKELQALDPRPEVPLVGNVSPNCKGLLWSDKHNSFSLWELASGKKRLHFTGHRGEVTALAFSPDGRTVASGSGDTSILLWDVDQMASVGRPGDLRPDALASLGVELGSEDSTRAYGAIRKLTSVPRQAVTLIKEQLKPAAAPNAARLARLIGDLDDKDFATREKATADLEGLGDLAEGTLRRLVEGDHSAEAGRRAEALLEKLKEGPASPALLRTSRALEVLEDIGTAQAQELLKTLAEGLPEARLTSEAKASLGRINRKTESAQ
jgi:RNA polymerase sigma factor (sigma-70 family)